MRKRFISDLLVTDPHRRVTLAGFLISGAANLIRRFVSRLGER